ncbi:hypothetical protein BH18CHL2_BH18CHL2_02110 [soil metagenome]
MTATVLFAALLVAYGNGTSLLFRGDLPGGHWIGLALGSLLLAGSLVWARAVGLRRAELGLCRRRLVTSALVGALLAAVAAAAALVVLRFPPLLGESVTYAPARAVEPGPLATHLLVFLPLSVVIPEEIAFRGALLGALLRRIETLRAVTLSACVFALWHVVITITTIELTNLNADRLFAALGAAGALVAVLVGGAAFALLRLRTGNLAASVAAHRGFNAAILVGLRSAG